MERPKRKAELLKHEVERLNLEIECRNLEFLSLNLEVEWLSLEVERRSVERAYLRKNAAVVRSARAGGPNQVGRLLPRRRQSVHQSANGGVAHL